MDEKKLKVNLNPEQTPALYVDTIFMNVSDDGVTLDMCQKIGNGQEIQVVSRVGMSKEHAAKFVKKLSNLLALTETSSEKKESTN